MASSPGASNATNAEKRSSALDCGIACLIKRHLTAVMQLLTNTVKQYGMAMRTTKCLNTAVMMMYLMLGETLALPATKACDCDVVRERKGTDPIASEIAEELVLSVLRDSDVKGASPELHYVMLTDGKMPRDTNASNASNASKSTSSAYFPGHVFVIERSGDGRAFRLYQSYIGRYDLATHMSERQDARISRERLGMVLSKLSTAMSKRTWTPECSEAWSEMTHVPLEHSRQFEGFVREGVILMCHRRVKLHATSDALHRLAASALAALPLGPQPESVEAAPWGDTSLYTATGEEGVPRPLTVAEMRVELLAITSELQANKKPANTATNAASTSPTHPSRIDMSDAPHVPTLTGGRPRNPISAARRKTAAAAKRVAAQRGATPKVPADPAQRQARIRQAGLTKARTANTRKSPGKHIRVDWKGSPEIAAAELGVASHAVQACRTKTLVLIYSPQCGYCVQLRPEFDAAAKALTSAGTDVLEIHVQAINSADRSNAAANALTEAVQQSGLNGVPHMFAFEKQGSMLKGFGGERSAAAIYAFGRAM